MAYDISLEARIDSLTVDWELTKQELFGGLGYFLESTMCFAIRGDELLLRLDYAKVHGLLKKPGVHTAEMGARTMKNWIQAGGDAIADDDDLKSLLVIGQDYATTHPKP